MPAHKNLLLMSIKRYAVVVIHGIGSPMPMDTLRNFVAGVKNFLAKSDISECNTVIRSKPDKIALGFETRMLRLSKSRRRPAVDFYEFYWAHNMKGNKFSDFSCWISGLLTTWVSAVPENLRFAWRLVWGIILCALLIFAGILFIGPVHKMYSRIASFSFFTIILFTVFAWLKRLFLNLAGDAGRYFTPKSSNIESRFEIRKKGIELLKSLHDCRKYDRIILVGHSLGSVIGYDLVRLLWSEVYDDFDKSKKTAQASLKRVNILTRVLNDSKKVNKKLVCDFQECQYSCLNEYRNLNLNWLITDFITIGSPLCNMDFLSGSKIPFRTLLEEREYPCCPPLNDEPKKAVYYVENIKLEDGYWGFKTLHHAALFAVTRWTNIYYKSDFIGGAVSPLFGNGVKDIPVESKIPKILLGGHTRYWRSKSGRSDAELADKAEERAIKEICRALHF